MHLHCMHERAVNYRCENSTNSLIFSCVHCTLGNFFVLRVFHHPAKGLECDGFTETVEEHASLNVVFFTVELSVGF